MKNFSLFCHNIYKVIYIGRFYLTVLFALIGILGFIGSSVSSAHAQVVATPTPPAATAVTAIPQIAPVACKGGGCPTELQDLYAAKGETCVITYEEFAQDPVTNHFWIEDPEITAQGKADERARQFIYWVLNKNAIDDHPILKSIWNTTRNISYFLTIFIVAIIGLGFIIGQRANFQLKIQIWPALGKVALILIYITFSASIVLLLIQLSEILMRFFIENLGGRDIFNIYFAASTSQEKNYDFVGCRDMNYRVQEAVQAEVFLLKLTNITYYVMGTMLILRKILLWFMLFVSPMLALLMPFVFIRNIGWIWIGVFFQWLFYGPLFALFLGALAKIWKNGIPFAFDFSRTDTPQGYIYPTAINLLYGGPAQKLSATNTGNYVDTFAEYVITLIMLWAVTFFPWWLLRIFRDYCCDGIMAMKNILLSMYDQMRANPTGPNGPAPQPISFTAPNTVGTTINITDTRPSQSTIKLETIEQVRNTKTEDIKKNLNLSMKNIVDIARFETNNTSQQTVKKNIEYLSNPTKAETPTERQKYMNIRTELFNRAIKEDRIAKQILSATSTSAVDRIEKRAEIFKETAVPNQAVSNIVSVQVNVPEQKVQAVTTDLVNSIAQNSSVVNNISQVTNTPTEQVQQILNTYTQNISQPMNQVINNISKQTNLPREKIANVLQQTTSHFQNVNTINQITQKESVTPQVVEHVMQQIPSTIDERVATVISNQTNIAETQAVSTIQNVVSTAQNDQTFVNTLQAETGLNKEQVHNFLNTYTQNINQPTSVMIKNIQQNTGLQKQKVNQVIQKISSVAANSPTLINSINQHNNLTTQQTQNIIKSLAAPAEYRPAPIIAAKTNLPEQKVNNITNSLLSSITNNKTLVQNIENKTGVKKDQIRTILTTYVQNADQPTSVISERIKQTAGVEHEKVKEVLTQVNNEFATSKKIVEEVAQKQGVKQEDVAKIMQAQIPLVVEPQRNIEKTIALPSTVSIEDYEEVKKMWKQQYENGEVPVTENVSNRNEWIDQEQVIITNTLNKLLSADENLKQQGLEEVGYILPIFMINNLRGDELLIYLKAKLEAAKAVQEQLEKEEEIKEKVKEEKEKEDEELVDVKREDKKEKEKTMELEQELDEPKEKDQQSQNSTPLPDDPNAPPQDPNV